MIQLERRRGTTKEIVLPLHGRDDAAFRHLLEVCVGLAEEPGSVAIHDLPGVRSVNGCQLIAVRSESYEGVRLNGNRYIWTLDSEGWRHAYYLLEPFAGDIWDGRCQFLEGRGDAMIIYSTDGQW
jgi:hypothetical protein